MESIIMYHVVGIIQMLVFTIYLKELIGLKRSVWCMVICWNVLVIVNWIVTNVTTSVAINGITYVLLLELISFYMCSGSWRRKLFLVFVYYGMNALVEIMLIGIVVLWKNCDLNMIANSDIATNILLILTQMCLFIIILAIRHLWKNPLSYDISVRNWIGCFVVSAGCFLSVFILTIYMIQNNKFEGSLVGILFIWICMNFFSYYVYFVSAEKNRIEMEARTYENQIKIYETWYEEMQQTKKEIQSIRHDMKNHFATLRELCRGEIKNYSAEKHLKEIRHYLDSIGINVMNSTYGIDSGNLMLDAIITLKKNYALSKGIVMDVDICVPRDMNYNNVDIVVILGNILDNAIEACETLENTECRA